MKDLISKEKADEALAPFITEFYADRLDEIKLVDGAAQSGDFSLIKEIAHKWKGFSAPYGFNHLGVLAIELESSAKSSDQSKCMDLVSKVKHYMDLKKNNLNL
jgi:HPt (histidine-containing phosphotransfer) domain-containing protein